MIRNKNQTPSAKLASGFLVAISTLFLLVFLAGSAWAKGAPQLLYEAEGKSSVQNNDYNQGRARAVDYAFKNALTVALQDLLGGSAYRRNRKSLERMLKFPEKYIKQYRFLEFYDSDVEQFSRVKMEVVFFPDAINRALSQLGILSSLVKPNTAIVLVNERSLSAETPPDFWDYVPISEVAILQKFLAAGVKVTTREKISEMVDENTVFEAMQGDLDAAVDIGLKAKVDIVIVGTAVTTRQGDKNAEGLITVQSNLTLRAVSTTQSVVIAARSDFASVQAEEEFKGELQAFEVVGKKMAVFFLDAMKRYWEPKPQPDVTVGIDDPDPNSGPDDSELLELSPSTTGSTPSIMEDL
ncbi:MAG: hypothetical protein OEY26_03625 [Nitrospinota bacterium]|nr:hypothetical protein [Nitrospinota bacterium]